MSANSSPSPFCRATSLPVERLRLGGRDDAAQRLRARVDLQRAAAVDAPLDQDEAEPVARAEPDVADLDRSAARSAAGAAARGRASSSQPRRSDAVAPLGPTSSAVGERDEQRARAGRRRSVRDGDDRRRARRPRAPRSRSTSSQDAELAAAPETPERDEQRERRGEDRQLGRRAGARRRAAPRATRRDEPRRRRAARLGGRRHALGGGRRTTRRGPRARRPRPYGVAPRARGGGRGGGRARGRRRS